VSLFFFKILDNLLKLNVKIHLFGTDTNPDWHALVGKTYVRCGVPVHDRVKSSEESAPMLVEERYHH
jgi:hypothetical protein